MKPSPKEMRALAERDPRLGAAMKRLPPFPGFPTRDGVRSHYESLARAIVYQQLATRAAATIHGRLCSLGSGGRFPRPPELLCLSDERLRGAGLSRNKLAALRDLAERVADGRLPLARISRCDDEAITRKLTEVRGIGPWSAQMFLLFRLGRLDVMPATDLGIQEGMRRLDGMEQRPTPRDVLARAEVWRPLCSVASWTLWRLCDPAPRATPVARSEARTRRQR